MQRIFDITACLFSPPVDPDTEIQLYWNERLEYSTGDQEEKSRVDDSKYLFPKPPPTMSRGKQDSATNTPLLSDLSKEDESFTSIVHRKGILSKDKNIHTHERKSKLS